MFQDASGTGFAKIKISETSFQNMNRIAICLLGIAAGAAIAWAITTKTLEARSNALLASRQAVWDAEKSALEEALRHQPKPAAAPAPAPAVQVVAPAVPAQPTARDIIETLRSPKLAASPRGARIAIHQLETLIALGTNALPAIREFLAQNQDIPYDTFPGNRRGRGVPADFVIPPSLRFGLFDVAKQIGGPDAEKLLADTLQTSGRPVEVAWLAKALQETAPDKYRDLALTAAHDLLDHPAPGSANDKTERDYLYGVLALYGDTSLVSQSQAQLIKADGQLDASALAYLQKSLGEKSLPIAIQAYNDPKVDPAQKEALARVGLFYAGINPDANQFFDAAVHDQNLSLDARRNYIEDLNQDGLANRRDPTPEDQKIIDARLKLIQAYSEKGGLNDPILNHAFEEAQKDLLTLQKKSTPH